MCGRYYIDDSAGKEIEKLIRQTDEKLRHDAMNSLLLQPGDICPTQIAPVLTISDKGDCLCCRMQRWGFLMQPGYPGNNGKKIIFNVRSETAEEKPMFSESLTCRRIVVPAAYFYEWNRNKEKNIFYQKGKTMLFMAGFYHSASDGEHFVILTTQANESMKPVHDRMPLLLDKDEIFSWIFETEKTHTFLNKKPCLLERYSEYEQLNLF